MLANAAAGSVKNIVPNLLIAASKRPAESRDIDSQRGACLRCAGGLSGRLPRLAADVEDVVVELDITGLAQDLIVPLQFGVVSAVHRWRAATPRPAGRWRPLGTWP